MGRIMSLDYGSVTIGIALTDPMHIIVSPSETLVREKENKLRADLRHIVDIIKEQDVELVLLGFPLNMDGSIGERARKTAGFAGLLERRIEAAGLSVPVELWDERLSTVAADEILAESEIPARSRKKYIDRIAAAVILEDWLAAHKENTVR